jgi:hypothetical protein
LASIRTAAAPTIAIAFFMIVSPVSIETSGYSALTPRHLGAVCFRPVPLLAQKSFVRLTLFLDVKQEATLPRLPALVGLNAGQPQGDDQ